MKSLMEADSQDAMTRGSDFSSADGSARVICDGDISTCGVIFSFTCLLDDRTSLEGHS